MRDTSDVTCAICETTYSSAGMHTHLKHAHDMTVDEYVNGSGTEYRKKHMNKTYDYECKECGENVASEKALTLHVKNEHNMSKKEYAITHYHNGTHPTCKCGCGQETSFITYAPYFREYISGHNSKGISNPMYGRSHSKKTKQKMRKQKEESLHRRFEYHNLILEDEYQGLERNPPYTTYEIRCTDCDTSFESQVKAARIPTCPHCKNGGHSKPQREIIKFIKNELNIQEVHQSNRTVLESGKELDIYIPKHNFAIEYDSLYWHSQNNGGKQRSYHLNKTTECEDKGIHLFHVFGDEWRQSKGIVKSRIKNKLKKIEDIRYARNTHIKQIENPSKKNKFLNKHHLQGEDRSTYKYGLYDDNNVLLSVMTFARASARMFTNNSYDDDGTYELSRFASKKDTVVVGAFGKLFKHFLNKHNPTLVYSYADRRYTHTQNNVYSHFDFELVSNGVPGYWYVDSSYNSRMHRYNFTKRHIVENMNGDPELSEWENMKEMNYDRIWDCGHLKFEYTMNAQ